MLGSLARQRPVVYGLLGCMAQSRGSSLLKDVPHLDLVVGTQKFHRVAEYVEQALNRKASQRWDDVRFSIVDVGEETGSRSTILDPPPRPQTGIAFFPLIQGRHIPSPFFIFPPPPCHQPPPPTNSIFPQLQHSP